MTEQTKRFIELSDIMGLRLDCKQCGTSLLVSGETLRTLADKFNEGMLGCPTCPARWAENTPAGIRTSFDSEIKYLIRAIQQVQQIEDKLGCSLSLEIKIPAPPSLESSP